MKEPNHTPNEFCQIATEFTGEKVEKLGQIVAIKFHGAEIFEFVQYYFSKVYSRFLSEELRRKDDTIYRLRCIVVALCIIIAVLIIK